MAWSILWSSVGVSLVILVLVALKWRIEIRIAIIGGLIIGMLTAVLVKGVYLWDEELRFPLLLCLEAFLTVLITVPVILLRFYRDPERIPAEVDNVIISPADGKVLFIKHINEQEVPLSIKKGKTFKLEELAGTDLLHDGAYLIGIEMSVLDVHTNRAPIGGDVLLLKRVPGRFISLRREEAVISNERMTTVISNGRFKVGVVQIASRTVRRIVSFLKEGQALGIGQRIGMIVFGSQVDLVIPKIEGLSLMVREGDRVVAGVSLIARYGTR